MHKTMTIDSETAEHGDTVALNWDATLLVVQNLTAQSILCRIGGLDIPSDVDDADIYVAPFSSITYSVNSRQFGFAFGNPSVSPVPPGSPTKAIVTLSTLEPVPTFSGMPITNVNAQLSGTVDANLTGPIDLAAGTEVGLVAGTQVTLPNGQVVTLPAGTEVGLETGTTIGATINNPNLPVSNYNAEPLLTNNNIYYTGTEFSFVGNDSINRDIVLRNGTTAVLLISDMNTNNYAVAVIGTDTGHVYYSQTDKPRDQLLGIAIEPSNNRITIQLRNNNNQVTKFKVYGIVGASIGIELPNGMTTNVKSEILGTGYQTRQFTIGNIVETVAFDIDAPGQGEVLVIDNIYMEVGMQGTGGTKGTAACFLYIRNNLTNATAYAWRCWNPDRLIANGPVYVSPSYNVRGNIINNSGSTLVFQFGVAYHYQSQ